MNTILKNLLIILISIAIISCAVSKPSAPNIPEDRKVSGHKVFVNGELYAEIVIIGKSPFKHSYRGIAIHYVNNDRYEWISPGKGFSLKKENKTITDIQRLSEIWKKEPSGNYIIYKGKNRICCDSYFKLEWRGGLAISEDALYVYYVEASIFGPKDRKYIIKY